jgi:hypothetical protein
MITFQKWRGRWILAAVFVLGLSALFFVSTRRAKELPDFLQNPGQGYELYLKAGEELAGRAQDVTNGFANYVAMNKRAYDALDRAKSESVEAPTRMYEPGGMNTDFMVFKQIGYAMVVRSRGAEEEGKLSEAVDRCLETIRFGQKVEHGPMISFLVGMAVEGLAMNRLEELMPKLSQTNLTAVIPKFIEANRSRIEYAEVVRREQYFLSRNAKNFVEVLRATFSFQTREMLKNVRTKGMKTAARMVALATAMAVKEFEMNRKGAVGSEVSLKSVKELTPRYLKEVPMDPFSNGELRLVRNGEKWLVYSVGPNGRDEAGNGDDVVARVW